MLIDVPVMVNLAMIRDRRQALIDENLMRQMGKDMSVDVKLIRKC